MACSLNIAIFICIWLKLFVILSLIPVQMLKCCLELLVFVTQFSSTVKSGIDALTEGFDGVLVHQFLLITSQESKT